MWTVHTTDGQISFQNHSSEFRRPQNVLGLGTLVKGLYNQMFIPNLEAILIRIFSCNLLKIKHQWFNVLNDLFERLVIIVILKYSNLLFWMFMNELNLEMNIESLYFKLAEYIPFNHWLKITLDSQYNLPYTEDTLQH